MGNTYIGLLRGINVSGQKKIKMAELRRVLEEIGLQKVKTYIQSGNIVFEGGNIEQNDLQRYIFDAIYQNFGFEVPVLLFNKEEIEHVLNKSPFMDTDGENRLYYVWLRTSPKHDLVEQFNQHQFKHEDYFVTDKCVYLLCKNGYGRAKLNNNYIENKLKVEATTRNRKTMLKLLEMIDS